MAFNVKTWNKHMGQRLEDWKPRWEQAKAAGASSLYAFLSAMALWPVVEAYRQGDLAAILALGGVLGDVGTNLLANEIQFWKDEADARRHLARAAEESEEIRAELDAVLERLDVLSSAQASLEDDDRAWFVETLQEELARLGNLERYQAELEGSGAIAQGEGATAVGERGVEGDIRAPVVTGDQSWALQAEVYAETYIAKLEIAPDSEEAKSIRARFRYFKRLYQQCNALPLAALGGDEGIGEEVTLDQVYVTLDTRTKIPLSEEEKERARREAIRLGDEEHSLSALEAVTQNRRAVLLGDPGSGKSTFVRQLAAWLAAVHLGLKEPIPDWESDLVPVIIILRELGARLIDLDLEGLSQPEQRERLVDEVKAYWRGGLSACNAAQWAVGLEDALTDGNVLLVFDGLDEVSQACRGRVRRAVQALLAAYPAVRRVILTSRIRSYVGEAVIPGFSQYTLAPFTREKIQQFVKGWYGAQVALGRLRGEQAEDRARDLQDAALSSDLQELASNPMLLTTMAIIHQREIGLPRERVRLYSLAIQVLLSRWQRWKGIAVSDELESILRDDLRMRAILERLAYEAHCCQAEQGESADLVRRDLWALLEDPALLGDVGLADEFLDYVDQRAGLLVGQGGGDGGRHPQTYAFPHRTFQEYLAGAYMVGRRGTTRECWRRASEGDTWYLAALLGAEELLYNRRSAKELLDLAYALCPQTPPGDESAWRAALWSGQMATLLGAEVVRRDTERPNGGAAYLERLVPRQVIILRKTSLGAVERADAGNVLARLGDPRFREDAWHLPDEPLLGFVEIPKGPFTMGTREEDIPALMDSFGGDREWYEWETPQHEAHLRTYYIARYPVIQAQYAAFVRDTGHNVPSSLLGLEGDRPFEWRGGSYPPGRANQPVVLVSWHDALAYCEWLTERLRAWDETPEPLATLLREEGWRITLPSETEWEKAARGPTGRIFPWGNEADSERANYRDTGIGTTSAVGCFPDGASPYGVEDLSGNVWEWCRTKWEENYQDYQGDDDLGGSASRVLRGGAFHGNDRYVRCAVRYERHPYDRLGISGFRVVASPVGGA